ncbi:MAG: hypothetical protein JRF53_00580 [Deltaproteobacteria bacterium]|nr:hypothetical protein [Deltaproteobacteria bacterium]
METIREQIILAVISKLAIIRTANGYNTEAGALVKRVQKKLDPPELPGVVVWPKTEDMKYDYGAGLHMMPLQVEGLKLHADVNPSVVAELLLGDLIEAMVGIVWSLSFTSGGTYEIEVGDTIEGATGGATGYVTGVSVATGTWAGGDAAGTLTLRRVTGTFQAENLDVGTDLNVATIAGAPTGTDPVDGTAGGFAEAIEYAGGGIDEYPEGADEATGVVTNWNIKYRTLSGDPYHQ